MKASAAVLAFLLLPSLAVAAGLGKLTVFSGLGQPLKAEIQLLAVQKDEADNLSVHLPPADAFRQANIEYAGALLSLKFNIEQRGEGDYVVKLSSSQPINEPFLDLLVELDSKTSRLVREYTFLLDPPGYKEPQAAAAIAAPSVAAPGIKSVEMPKPIPTQVQAATAEHAAAAAAPVPAAPSATVGKAAPTATGTYLVKRGDTLTKIANANRSGGVSLQQMLVALFRSNADAFIHSNMNRMRAGKILNIPDMQTAAAVDQGEAARMVSAQAADFNAYRRRLAAAVAAGPARAERRRQSARGKITPMGEHKPAPAEAAKDRLKISKAEQAGKTGALRSRQALHEDLIAKEAALKEANERIALLEKNVQDMQKLLELKSEAGAQLQQHATVAAAVKAPEPAKTAGKAPEQPKTAAKTPEAAKAEGVTPKPPAPKAVPNVAPPIAPHKVAPPKAPHRVVAPRPIPEPSLVDQILGNTLALYGGGGFLLLLFAAYGYYAWRRKKTQQIMESSAIGAPELAADSVFGAAGGAKIDTGGGEIEAGLAPGGAAMPTEEAEVDPIAEADVYMAYGRDVQAEEILKEALAKDPSRQPVRAKLLEIYANRKDPKAFEAVAAEIHAATNGEGADWEKASALGAQLDPKNPLYGGKGDAGEIQAVTDTQGVSAVPDLVLDASGAPEAPPGLDFDIGGETIPGVAPQPEPVPAGGAMKAPDTTKASDTTAGFDFDLDLGGGEEKGTEAAPAKQQATVVEAPADSVSSIDFDFDLPGAGEAAQPAAAAPTAAEPAVTAPPELALTAPEAHSTAPAPTAEPGSGIDFDFNLDLPPQKEEEPSPPLDLSAINLDLGAPGEAAPAQDAHWQEVATKLDLAKAYQEMGDKDGARELLNEVLTEGDAAQKEQAQTLITALG
jgi:pilus assembly protein FimV